ncbi:Ni,Fe-hydrogenase III large subunit [Enhydrobacter aerosaccus]|uniref:Ni,Fe-hydrogenase III large subunit n=1 Tax=Enhydrobacter aerosaccus TaxID=225324 RepID=A0A1T4PWF0_9HYPH|nr:NADH-quinone oxidoreductase subunit C [Enhydrobacter aerosaccus]SJZ95904.1 Ni,Fe-hydrogenase III large subunit [Enhydrobacter aerosaccus]
MSAVVSLTDLISGREAGRDGYVRLDVTPDLWTALARSCAQGSVDLSALWADGGKVRMALNGDGQRVIVSLETDGGAYPSVAAIHAPAMRLERAARDLYGLRPVGLPDERAWLDHGRWPDSTAETRYTFLPVEGDDLHQIPVGPVHAGIIEPGHFRFTASGETVVRLEERLGYVHKGVERLMAGADIARGAKLAARISGDSTVAYGWAFAGAVEAALDWVVPPRGVMLRAVLAEIERLSHHISDVGAICNDASVITINARCMLQREDVLTVAKSCFGHRMMMDRIVPGGVAVDLSSEAVGRILELLDRLEETRAEILRVYDSMPSLQDRTVTTGIVKPDLARQFAAGGYVGRASGRAFDARKNFAYAPYDRLDFDLKTRSTGDVDGRLMVRMDEIVESTKMIRGLLHRLPAGPVRSDMPAARAGEGAALIEAFRGDVFMTVRLDEAGRLARAHARDASWFQWPLLEAAIEGNIVADFPLCNKSFNCSYSGHDL